MCSAAWPDKREGGAPWAPEDVGGRLFVTIFGSVYLENALMMVMELPPAGQEQLRN
jgi:hypothetical protein